MTTEQPSGTPAQNTETPATPAPQTPTSAATDGSPKAREYTQAELDQLFAERSTRAAQQATKKLLDALGVASVDDIPTLKTTIEEARKRQDADLTESQRLQKQLESEQKALAILKAELDTERAARKTHTIDAAIKAAAVGVVDPAMLLLHLRTAHADAVNALLTEEGAIDDKRLAALLTQAKQEKAYLFGSSKTPGVPSNSGGTPRDPDAKTKEKAIQDVRRHIRSGF